MTEIEDGLWRLLASDKLAYAKVVQGTETIIDCPDEDNEFWEKYFDLQTDYSFFAESVDDDDIFLKNSVEFGRGIRILRQDPWEMLITFIISQRRSIPSIRTCVERLCERYGTEIEKGIFAFPTPDQLASACMDELCGCGLGYRADYVFRAAQAVSCGEIDLYDWIALCDEDLLERLLALRGVGVKVANCVSLFGYHRIAAFPIDVWIDRVQQQYYNGSFPLEKYPGFAGVMQQYMFFYIRNN